MAENGKPHGDFFVDTVFGVGKYWREVLSPATRRVTVSLERNRLVVDNGSDIDLECLPVDMRLAGGGRTVLLVSVRAGQRTELNLPEN